MPTKKSASKSKAIGQRKVSRLKVRKGVTKSKLHQAAKVKKTVRPEKKKATSQKMSHCQTKAINQNRTAQRSTIKFCQPKPRFDLALVFILLLSAVLLVGYAVKVVWAAEFAEPPGGPAEGNIPVTIWNRDATIIAGEPPGLWPVKQQDTSINIDGQFYLGDTLLDLGGTGDGQYLLYGVARYLDGPAPYTYYMDSDDYFIRFDASYTDYPAIGENNTYRRFSLDRSGNLYAAGAGQLSSWLSIGSTNYQMALNGTSNYLLYGVARFDGSNPGGVYYADPDLDYLLWLRSYDYFGVPAAGYTDRFTVDVTGDVWAKGSLRSEGCFGAVFTGLTVSGGLSGDGRYRPQDVSGYYDVNSRCVTDYPGAHVCTSAEILESLRCSVATSPIRTIPNGSVAWINSGPPGHTSNYNDCEGWTSAAASSYARYWIFNQLTGGRGTGVSCNVTSGIQFTCCR
ncbi:hypothetical protein KKF05_01150 [Patescibacteria group bacterium]|nr:hypothetical protein [Patescibacteria group bacterium]MBU1028986.1 hypothetical protein [Patescibacteria group bacterium]MBU1916088.1 hypothetical protein [Patescibacteria group bacterium]